MRKWASMLTLLLLAGGELFAQQIATVTSSGPFSLRGATVDPGQGAPNFPAIPGDTIKAVSALTTVTFSDGSVITMDQGSEGRVEFSAGQPIFRLLAGRAQYRFQTATAIGLADRSQRVTPQTLSGVLTPVALQPRLRTPDNGQGGNGQGGNGQGGNGQGDNGQGDNGQGCSDHGLSHALRGGKPVSPHHPCDPD